MSMVGNCPEMGEVRVQNIKGGKFPGCQMSGLRKKTGVACVHVGKSHGCEMSGLVTVCVENVRVGNVLEPFSM